MPEPNRLPNPLIEPEMKSPNAVFGFPVLGLGFKNANGNEPILGVVCGAVAGVVVGAVRGVPIDGGTIDDIGVGVVVVGTVVGTAVGIVVVVVVAVSGAAKVVI